TFELNYTKQKGDLKLYINGTETAYTILEGSPIVADNDAEKTLKIKIASLTADSTKRTLRVQFTGANSCDKEYILPAAPFSPRITGQTATMSAISCGSDKYTLNVTFTATNSLGRDVTIRFKGNDYVRTTADGSNTFSFANITRETVMPNDQEVQIFYTDATYCTTPVKASYVETPVPTLGITIADNQGDVACDAADYILKGAIDYVYLDQYPKVQLGSGTIYDLGSDAYKDLISLNNTALQHFDISKLEISVPADSSAQTLKVSAEGRAEACGTISESFKTIWRPQAGTVTFDRPNMVHCDEPYDLKVTVPYTRGVSGKKIYAECSDNGTPKSAYATLANGAGTAIITLSGLTETGDANHAITLYFEGRKVSCPIKSYTYDEPTRKVLSAFTVTAVGKECESDAYSLTGSIKSNVAGESVTIWYDDDHKTTVTSVVGLKEFAISNFNTTGNGLPIKAYFTNHNEEHCSEVATTFDTPVKPVISIENAEYSDPDCVNSPTTTTLTFDLNYTMQSGTLTVWVDEDIDKHEVTYTNTTPKVEQTKTGISVSGIPADGKAHTLYVNFDGDKSCHNKSFAVGTAPFSPKVSDITAEMKEVKCGVNTDKLQVDFKVENSQGAEATIHVKGKDYKLTTHDGVNTYTTPALSRETTTPNNQTVQISFASATHCKTPAEKTYIEMPAPALGITIAADQGAVGCDDETYILQGTIDYTYIDELPEVWLDDKTPIALTESQVDLLETATKHVDLADLNIFVPTDGQQHHLYVKADGWAADCGTIDEEFTSVWRPQISAVNSKLSSDYVHCDDSYFVTLKIDYSRAVVGKKLHASCTDKGGTISGEATLDAISGTATITLSGLREQGNNAHALTLYFDGLEATCPINDYTYAEPTTIAVTGFTASEQPKDCDDVNYTVTGTIQTNFATDAKIIISDGFGNETAPLAASTTGTPYSLEVSGSDLTGTGNHLTATFVGHTACTATSEDFDEPVKPTAKVESVTPKQPDCDVTTYELDFEISYTYQPDKVTVWVDDHKAEKTFDIETGQTDSKTLTGKLSGDDLVADGSTGHVLHYQFAGTHACGGSQEGTFTAPRTPLIKNIEDVERPDRILCTDATYDAIVKVSTENAVGEKVIVKYTYGSSVKITDAVVVPAGGYVEIPVTFDKKDGVSHETIYVYFEGADFAACQETETHKKVFTTPSSSAINDFFAEIHDLTTCDNLLYSLSGTITYGGSASGDMIISFDDIHTKDTIIPMANCNPAGTPFTLSGLTQPVSSYAISARFDGETCTSHSQEFNSPVVPTVEIANANYSAPACNETTTDLTFDLTYTKQDGDLHVRVDGVEKTYTIKSGDEPSLSDAPQTVTLVISDLLADESKRSLQVWFDGEKSCGESSNKTFSYPIVPQAPFSPKVLTTKAEMKDVECDKDTYTLEVTFTVENSQNKPATLVFPRGSSTPVEVNTTDGTYTYTFANVNRTFSDATDDYVELSFADAVYCTTPTRIDYTETAKPTASVVSVKANQPACDVTTFTIDFKLSYTYQHGNVTVWVDDHKAEQTFTIPADSIAQSTAKTITGTLSGADLVADGSTGHVLHFQFAGDNACDGESAAFAFPVTPLITSVSVSNVPEYIEGLEGTYNPIVTVTYIRATGDKRIVLEYLDKDDKVKTAYSSAVTGDNSYTFDNLTFDDVTKGNRVLHAYFEDSNCKSGKGTDFNHDGEYKAPTNSSVKIESLELVNTSTCAALRYNVKGTVSFVGAVLGDLVVEFDGTNKTSIPKSQCEAVTPGTPIPFEITGIGATIPEEGKSLTAYFSGAETNFTTSEAKVYEPVQPSLAIDEVKVDTTFSCGSKRYAVTVTISSANQQGTCYVLDSIDGRVPSIVATHEGTFNGSDEFTIALPTTDEQHYVVVRYSATGCEEISQALDINTYTKPMPIISLTAIDRLCNDETELVLPLVIKQGDIDEATLTLTDSKGATVISAADMNINAAHDALSYSLSSQLAAGKYTATVEARDTLDCETSATLPIEFALDGVVFSKWTDVLLVDNADGLFTGYQWYENGVQLDGKTAQVLYMPEKDMTGNSYYCRLQTAEGDIYTCERVFGNDLPRSADNPKPQTTNHITVLPNRVAVNDAVTVRQSANENLHLILMSVTGKRVAEYAQQEAAKLVTMPGIQGIYLLRVEAESDVQTVKIVVY
ncbi:MAG: T9SS type A sorting domain-containing protein, partial [Paludibacteraceae bacterium]|nr:T9SS type A sorting domain-containing protein [Paludibacteraceae bacterium]